MSAKRFLACADCDQCNVHGQGKTKKHSQYQPDLPEDGVRGTSGLSGLATGPLDVFADAAKMGGAAHTLLRERMRI